MRAKRSVVESATKADPRTLLFAAVHVPSVWMSHEPLKKRRHGCWWRRSTYSPASRPALRERAAILPEVNHTPLSGCHPTPQPQPHTLPILPRPDRATTSEPRPANRSNDLCRRPASADLTTARTLLTAASVEMWPCAAQQAAQATDTGAGRREEGEVDATW
jgi:hypothetical protein